MLIVSNYHYIREDFSSAYESIFGVTPKQFRSQLEKLSRIGEFVSQDDLLAVQDKRFDKTYVLITFDDGLREQYELAKPILDKMGIPFVCFINTSNFWSGQVSLVHKIHLVRSRLSSTALLFAIREAGFGGLDEGEQKQAQTHYCYDDCQTAELKYILNLKLSMEQQRNIIDPVFSQIFSEKDVVERLYFDGAMLDDLFGAGVLGSHSDQHVPLGQLALKDVRSELKRTQEFFVQRFGAIARTISYPYGSFEASVGISEEVRLAGFDFGFTMERAANESMDHPYLLARFDCNDLPGGKHSLFEGHKLSAQLPVRNWFRK